MAKQIGLNTWLNRNTKLLLTEVSSGGMRATYPAEVFDDGDGQPVSNANWIHAPDFTALGSFARKYAITQPFPVDTITLMDQAARDVVDALETGAMRDAEASELDRLDSVLRAFMLAVQDEFNLHSLRINAILDAIDNANNLSTLKTDVARINDLPPRTTKQLRTSIRNKLGT